jgi:2-desacetyl-2-hydroxyethyl bacteriochlorophyllide A dehydrogenase
VAAADLLGDADGVAIVSTTMRAARFTRATGFEVRAVPRPTPGPDEVLVVVHGCGICGSDLHFYAGAADPPHVCPGHEICGRVAAGATDLPFGTPVVVEPIRSCGRCARCVAGEPNLCGRLEILGSHLDGGFADAVLVPRASVYPIPEGLDLDCAVLAEPLAVAVHGVSLGDVAAGETALVLGGGVIGLLTAFVALGRGADVTISVRHLQQARAATAFGARVVDAEPDRVVSAVRGRRPDVVFETVGGAAPTVELALRAVRRGGRIVTLGVFTRPVVLDPLRFLAKETRIVASMMYRRGAPRPDFSLALELLCAERDRLTPLITHRVPLADIGRGFALAADKRSGAIKVRVDVAAA